MMTLSRDITLIIKVTNACDMKCTYCFIEPSVFHKTMKMNTAQRIIHAFLDSDFFESVNFVWHGGEPLLRGRRFYEQIFDEQRTCATRVAYTNSTQTNATHLTDDMLDFLVGNGVSIGLSLDGPENLTDVTRKSRRMLPILNDGPGCGNGRQGAHAITVDAARRLQARGQGAAAIVTVNRSNVARPEGVYEEFNSRRIHMKLNPLTRSGLANTPEGADLGITAEEYGEFLVRMFNAWFDDPGRAISIEPFGQHISRILGVSVAHSCFYTLSCHRFFLGISPDGDLFPCGMFQGEPSFRYGNIHEMPPERVAETVLFGAIESREKKVLQDCAKCAFLDLCYSGCMFHSLKDSKVLEEKDYYCAGYKMYFEHVLRRVHSNLIQATRASGSSTPPTSAAPPCPPVTSRPRKHPAWSPSPCATSSPNLSGRARDPDR